MVSIDEDEYLAHYGTPRKSGRYPWGSGETQDPRNKSYIQIINDLKKQGVPEKEIAKSFGISTTQLRADISLASKKSRTAQQLEAVKLKEKAYSNSAIAERMGLAGESSVRSLLKDYEKDKEDVLTQTSNVLRRAVAEKTFIDVGTGTETYLNISKGKLDSAIHNLKAEGYEVHTVPVTQLGTNLDTKVKVLAPPGTTWGDVRRNQDNIKTVTEFSSDGGRTYNRIQPPIAVNPNRVKVLYKEDGGDKADGVLFIREGVNDLSLGGKPYAQVRVQVGKDHYLKGMAMYKDDLPDGVDILFNTNKSSTGNKLDAMKELKKDANGKVDPDLPFSSVVRQLLDKPGDPRAKVISALNVVNEEGDWGDWDKNLSSQMLSKQSPALAKTQLNITYERRKNEYDDIMALTNPTVKKKLLEEFADSTDSSAVHLKAAALPRQATHVILPLKSVKEDEIYAPGYDNGEKVVLIRFPHGGKFEIPELKVNNKNREGAKQIGNTSRDAVGIHHKVAARLSGADFDGDTVLVIPNNRGNVKQSPALDGLKDFDPVARYRNTEVPRLTEARKNDEMGRISNLITDMTIKGASHDQLARAVRHSMVVIDAEKHHLDYKLSEKDNGISQLREEYQGSKRGGAGTLISRKKSYTKLPQIKPRPMSEGGPFDKETGQRVFVPTGRTRINRNGEKVLVKQDINKLSITEDAHSLSSNTPMERLYADHSNRLKQLANQARVSAFKTPNITYSKSANATYKTEVNELKSAIALAERNAPRERQAQILGNAKARAKRKADPNLDKATIKKINYQSLEEARLSTGASKTKIKLTQKQWDAIQAGAISNHMLTQVLKHADMKVVRELAKPKRANLMTNNMTARAQQLLRLGYTRAEVARDLGVSLTTLDAATT